jgi:hypothetical protein
MSLDTFITHMSRIAGVLLPLIPLALWVFVAYVLYEAVRYLASRQHMIRDRYGMRYSVRA